MRNIGKNKWFVLVARSAADKQQWIEAFRVQKDRIKSNDSIRRTHLYTLSFPPLPSPLLPSPPSSPYPFPPLISPPLSPLLSPSLPSPLLHSLLPLSLLAAGVAAGIARDTRSLMLDKGSKLHCRLKQEGRLLQDHRYRLRVYPKSFCGSELVQWLIEIGEAGDSSEAVWLGQGLLESGVIHHG